MLQFTILDPKIVNRPISINRIFISMSPGLFCKSICIRITSCCVLYQSHQKPKLCHFVDENDIRGIRYFLFSKNSYCSICVPGDSVETTTAVRKQFTVSRDCDFNDTPTDTQVVAIRYRSQRREIRLFDRSFGYDPPSIIVRVNPRNSESCAAIRACEDQISQSFAY